jgi:hypothetical protein
VGGGDKDETTRAARTALKRGAGGVVVNTAIFMVFGKQMCWYGWIPLSTRVIALAVRFVQLVSRRGAIAPV